MYNVPKPWCPLKFMTSYERDALHQELQALVVRGETHLAMPLETILAALDSWADVEDELSVSEAEVEAQRDEIEGLAKALGQQ